jgi:putative phage-type endonuclease
MSSLKRKVDDGDKNETKESKFDDKRHKPTSTGSANMLASHYYLLTKQCIKTHTDEWYKERGKRLTASDVPTVVGENPYAKPMSVFFAKCGIAPKKFIADTRAIEHGHKYEAIAADFYEKVTGIELIPQDFGLVLHPKYPQFGASPDRVARWRNLLIEIKCPFRRKLNKPNVVPLHYYGQVQFQMWVMDVPEAHFVQFQPAEGVLVDGIIDITVIQRDEDWLREKLPVIFEFWGRVERYWSDKGKPLTYTQPSETRPISPAREPDPNPKSYMLDREDDQLILRVAQTNELDGVYERYSVVISPGVPTNNGLISKDTYEKTIEKKA